MRDGQTAAPFFDWRENDAATLVERFVHGVLERGDELALLLEESRVRHRQQARAPAPLDPQRNAVAGEPAGEIVDHRHRHRRQALVLGGDGQDVERAARALQQLGVIEPATAQKKRLDPADSPVQLPQYCLQRCVCALGDVEDDGSLHLPFEFDRIGDDHQALLAQDQPAPLAKALLRRRREMGDVAARRRPDSRRNEGTALLLEQQQRAARLTNLPALQRQPARAKFSRGLCSGEGGPQRVVCGKSRLAFGSRWRIRLLSARRVGACLHVGPCQSG